MSSLRSTIENLANEFVSSILAAMQSASLADLAAQGGVAQAKASKPGRPSKAAPASTTATAPARRSGRRKRSSAADVQKLKDIALAAAKALKAGFSKGDVMRKSGSKVNLGRALTLLVAEGKLTKKGDRRLTRYAVK